MPTFHWVHHCMCGCWQHARTSPEDTCQSWTAEWGHQPWRKTFLPREFLYMQISTGWWLESSLSLFTCKYTKQSAIIINMYRQNAWNYARCSEKYKKGCMCPLPALHKHFSCLFGLNDICWPKSDVSKSNKLDDAWKI